MKRRWLAWLWPAGLLLSTAVYADGGSPVEVYQQEALLREIDSEQHLKQVQADQCQLVQDIELRARQAEYPAYQFLWGDMLTEGVCIPQNPELGVYYLRRAAQQALPAAFLRLGQLYRQGRFVQADADKAVRFFREAASLGNTHARIELAQMLVANQGSPLDYEDTYRWLSETIVQAPAQHQLISRLRAALAARMPANAVQRATRQNGFW
ncbi:tetratricopeptide repeat protein [Plesiomonas shigelloides]|uniref:Sodium-type flagellar protein MotX n=1 Tax=Plesiomonas shigelloides 302-73 TaxID=1315976 RepID=R8AM94_PLESH|nr:SEL1-like repeat protein [Plesiomonas shigelloides]EON87455.1 sodium-type flagellar protein MotX [Plesiomonas shigelloides 302-73]